MGNVVEQTENFIREVETLKWKQMEILELKRKHEVWNRKLID